MFSDNPEKWMVFLFPLITLALFLVAAIGYWFVMTNPLKLW